MVVSLPRVEYANSDKQAAVDDWLGFMQTRILPLPVLCEGCNGMVVIEDPWQIAIGGWSEDEVCGWSIPQRVYREIQDALIDGIVKKRAYGDDPDLVVEWSRLNGKEEDFAWRVGHAGDAGNIYTDSGEKRKAVRDVKHEMDLVASALVSRSSRMGDGFFTYCPHCEKFVRFDPPEQFRSDIWDFVKKRYVDAGMVIYDQFNKFPTPKAIPAEVPKEISLKIGSENSGISDRGDAIGWFIMGAIASITVFTILLWWGGKI